MSQLTLDLNAGRCDVETCTDPATHVATWSKVDGRTGHSSYCLDHANYMTCAWLALAVSPYSYPGVTDSVWIEAA